MTYAPKPKHQSTPDTKHDQSETYGCTSSFRMRRRGHCSVVRSKPLYDYEDDCGVGVGVVSNVSLATHTVDGDA